MSKWFEPADMEDVRPQTFRVSIREGRCSVTAELDRVEAMELAASLLRQMSPSDATKCFNSVCGGREVKPATEMPTLRYCLRG